MYIPKPWTRYKVTDSSALMEKYRELVPVVDELQCGNLVALCTTPAKAAELADSLNNLDKVKNLVKEW